MKELTKSEFLHLFLYFLSDEHETREMSFLLPPQSGPFTFKMNCT